MAMHMVMHIMPCVVVSPCAHAGSQGHGHAPPGALTGKPVTICLGRARALHRHWHWRWRWHWQRTSASFTSTDAAAQLRARTWPLFGAPNIGNRSVPSNPMGVLAVLFPVRPQGPPIDDCDAVNTPSVPYLATVPISARLLCPGINSCPHPTHHTPPPSFSRAAKHCHLHHPSLHPLMYSVPSTMLRGRGWRSGGLDFTMRGHGTVHTTVSRCIRVYTYGTGWARPNSPPFASDTTAATRITAWPRQLPHQGRERLRSSRW